MIRRGGSVLSLSNSFIYYYAEKPFKKIHKRPLVFEAIQWDGTSECIDAIINMGGEDAVSSGEVLEISFASDQITLSFLDYIIKEDNGDIAIMPLELFKETYEEINEE